MSVPNAVEVPFAVGCGSSVADSFNDSSADCGSAAVCFATHDMHDKSDLNPPSICVGVDMRAEAPEFVPVVLQEAGGGSAAAGNTPAEEPDVLFEKGNPHIRTGRLGGQKSCPTASSLIKVRWGKSQRKTLGQ